MTRKTSKLILGWVLLIAAAAAIAPSARASFSLARPGPTPPPPACKPGDAGRTKALQDALRLRGQIARQASRANVTYGIERLERMIERCGFTPTQIAATPAQLTQWKSMGAKAEAVQLKGRLSEITKFQAPPPLLLEFYALTNKDAGVPAAQIQREVSEFKNKGNAAADRERKSCTAVDLSSGFGKSRNQDSVGWCFGFTSADLLSYKLKTEISAADVALSHFRGDQNGVTRWMDGKATADYRGGFSNVAIYHAMKRGLCREADFNSEDNGANQLHGAIDRIQAIKNSWTNVLTGACQNDLKTAKTIFPNVTLAEVSSAISTSTQSAFVGTLADNACEPRLRLPEQRAIVTVTQKNDRLAIFNSIDQQLSNKNPVEISMNGGKLADIDSHETLADHVVLAVGRRFNEKTGCEYLIRNSWGANCNAHDPKYECKKPQGHVWVPKSIISESIHAETHLP